MKTFAEIVLLIWISLCVTCTIEYQREARKSLEQKIDSLSNQVIYLTNIIEDDKQF